MIVTKRVDFYLLRCLIKVAPRATIFLGGQPPNDVAVAMRVVCALVDVHLFDAKRFDGLGHGRHAANEAPRRAANVDLDRRQIVVRHQRVHVDNVGKVAIGVGAKGVKERRQIAKLVAAQVGRQKHGLAAPKQPHDEFANNVAHFCPDQ